MGITNALTRWVLILVGRSRRTQNFLSSALALFFISMSKVHLRVPSSNNGGGHYGKENADWWESQWQGEC